MSGGLRPLARKSRNPSNAQFRMPGSSASNFWVRFLSRSSSEIVTKCESALPVAIFRRQLLICGLWFAARNNLNGTEVKEFFLCKNRAVIVSPPVSCLTTASSNRFPLLTSTDVNETQPYKRCNIITYLVRIFFDEQSLEVGRSGIVSQQRRDYFEQSAFAILAAAIQQERTCSVVSPVRL